LSNKINFKNQALMLKKSNIRKIIFWIIDILKGGNINRHLKEINIILDDPVSKRAKKIQNNNLENILKHAVNTAPYYKNYNNSNTVLDFPVIKKTIIQDNFEQFQSLEFKHKNNFKVSTSGSTGLPFFLFQDKNKRNRNKADVIHFFKQCNHEIGNKLYDLGVWIEKKSALKSLFQNIFLVDISKLSNERIIKFLRDLEKDSNSNKAILGYVSAFETIIKFLETNNKRVDNIKLKSIITNSEYLSPKTKTLLEDYFNTPVFSRYSSEEVGIIAHQTISSPDKFVVNHASYHIEILNLNNDSPVKSGEYGRIVITDFFNYAMPLIRYDTGDVAKLNICDNGKIEFEQIEGRKMDLIYDTQGNILSSFIFYKIIYKYYEFLKQYQFIQQNQKDYEIKLNLKGDKFDFEKELIEEVKLDFGNDANVIITYTNEIPPLASGKRRKVVNNYIKTNPLRTESS
jgi:phenylacetate-CoA ligase